MRYINITFASSKKIINQKNKQWFYYFDVKNYKKIPQAAGFELTSACTTLLASVQNLTKNFTSDIALYSDFY